MIIPLIDKLRQEHRLSAEEYKALLLCQDADTLKYLQEQAREMSLEQFGNRVFIRGLIEITNHCRNNCYYCGIRKGNQSVLRYELTREDILECCREGYTLGFRTFVLQGGETSSVKDDFILETVTAIHREFPDCAITLSLGEKSRETYEHFFRAGANRYLLRHETHNEEHYHHLHPDKMSIRQRLQCLAWLKEIGYQTGTGIMVGSPGQNTDHLVEDLLFIEQFHPEISFHLPVNASEGVITLYHSISNACTGWTRTRNTGRSQRSNAKPFSPGTTEQILTL